MENDWFRENPPLTGLGFLDAAITTDTEHRPSSAPGNVKKHTYTSNSDLFTYVYYQFRFILESHVIECSIVSFTHKDYIS